MQEIARFEKWEALEVSKGYELKLLLLTSPSPPYGPGGVPAKGLGSCRTLQMLENEIFLLSSSKFLLFFLNPIHAGLPGVSARVSRNLFNSPPACLKDPCSNFSDVPQNVWEVQQRVSGNPNRCCVNALNVFPQVPAMGFREFLHRVFKFPRYLQQVSTRWSKRPPGHLQLCYKRSSSRDALYLESRNSFLRNAGVIPENIRGKEV